MLALLVVGYITAGRIGLLLAFANENASPVWAPTGLAIGALLLVANWHDLRRLARERSKAETVITLPAPVPAFEEREVAVR